MAAQHAGEEAAVRSSGLGIGVELDMDTVDVPFTRERALALQDELLEAFSAREFQDQLEKLEAEHTDHTSPAFRLKRQELALGVQAQIIVKYGFEGSLQGVIQMTHAIKDNFGSDAQVAANTKDIECLIRDNLTDHGHDVVLEQRGKHKDDHHFYQHWPDAKAHPMPTAGRGAEAVVVGGEAAAAHGTHEVAAHGAHGAEGVGVELDLDDIKVPLTKDRVLALQAELLEGFAALDFQNQLKEIEARYGVEEEGKSAPMAFRREREELALSVQSKILPKYGFRGTLEGVSEMVREVRTRFPDDAAVTGNIKAINDLLKHDHV